MKIIFLGTSSMVPTKERNQTSILLQYEGENILIDCGEGTQRQLRLANVHPANIDKILITHWHADHVLGLPGLLQTASTSVKDKEIYVYGPKKTKEKFKKITEVSPYRQSLKVYVEENKMMIQSDKYSIESLYMDHSAPCLAYSFKEKDKRKINLEYTKKFGLIQHPLLGELQKGKTITYQGKKITPAKATTVKKGLKVTIILDTLMCDNAIKIAKESDILICESTFSKYEEELAKEYKHLTAEQAALIAKKAKVKQLILAHFSQRYQDIKELEEEAKTIFKNTLAVKDLEQISI